MTRKKQKADLLLCRNKKDDQKTNSIEKTNGGRIG